MVDFSPEPRAHHPPPTADHLQLAMLTVKEELGRRAVFRSSEGEDNCGRIHISDKSH